MPRAARRRRRQEPDRVELAKLCSRVENDWVGAETGLLDQLASLLGEEGSALRIDFATLDDRARAARARRLAARHRRLGRRALARRRAATTSAARSAAAAREALGVEHLSDADPEAARAPRRPRAGRRARHVLNENRARRRHRRRRCARATSRPSGALLDASHASLRDDYEASVPEVEATVERAQARRRGRRAHDGRRLRRRRAGAATRPAPAPPTAPSPSPPDPPPAGSDASSSAPSGRHSAQAMKQRAR